jgi:hypothetical protein
VAGHLGHLLRRGAHAAGRLGDAVRAVREYAASTGGRKEFLESVVGAQADPGEPVTVDGVDWQSFVEADGSRSYVASYGDATVVVGTKRATASADELAVCSGR